nr:hypothetical protein [uncultured Blautia sp.]
MESYSIIQQYALIGLDGTDSKNKSVGKTAVLRAIATGRFVEKLMESGGHQEADFQEKLEQGIKEARALGTRELKEVEKEIAAPLKADGALEEAPDLLGCDMYYETSGADLKVYRSDKEIYLQRELFRNPYMEGVNILYPFLDRRQAIFIDFVVLGTTVVDRRGAVMSPVYR